MLNRCCRLAVFVTVVLTVPVLSLAQTAPHPQWVGAWATAPMLADGGFNVRPLTGVTLREIVHISAGGAEIRVRFTNAYGTDPLIVSDAHVALSAGSAAIQPGSDHAITFGGATTCQHPARRRAFLRSHCLRRAAAFRSRRHHGGDTMYLSNPNVYQLLTDLPSFHYSFPFWACRNSSNYVITKASQRGFGYGECE